MTAALPLPEHDPAYEKYLSDNRDRYWQQSAATRNGQVAPLPARDERAVMNQGVK